MSESASVEKASDGAKEQNQTISKAELDKIVSDKDSTISNLQKTVDDIQSKLLDDNYLEYIANKNVSKKEATKSLEKLGLAPEIIQEITAVKQTTANLQSAMQQIAAYVELSQIREAHSDFKDYEGDIRKILEQPANGHITFEQAYKMAKGDKAPKAEEKKEALKGNERPSVRVPSDDKVKEYANEKEANAGVIESLRSKYGLSGDTL